MPTMSFMPQLKEFLLRNRLIYTVRKYKMVEAVVDISGVGKCNRIPQGVVTKREELLPCIEQSGFASVKDWWAKVRYFTPDESVPLYLYRVEIVEED